MKNYNLYNKNAITLISLSKYFLLIDINSKLITIEKLSNKLNVGRGTIQNSIKILVHNNAIKLDIKGHLGTFLIEKNIKLLLEFANMKYLLGAMGLPTTKTFEGLATGIISNFKDIHGINLNMAYMVGAKYRMEALVLGHYDFIICAKQSANYVIHKDKDLEIVAELGPKSYITEQVLLFSEPNIKTIKDGMNIALIQGSTLQNEACKTVCKDYNVNFITMPSDKVLIALKNKKVHATIWNKDEINDILMEMNMVTIDENADNSIAVILAPRQNKEMIQILRDLIDIEYIRNIQENVMNGKVIPRY